MPVVEIKSIGGGQVVTQPAAAPATAIRSSPILPSEVQDPRSLANTMTTRNREIDARLTEAFSSPLLGGVLIRGVTLTATTTTAIKHGLGRPWSGYFCVRAQSAAFAAYDVANATGLTAQDVLTIYSANTGTYDIWVF